MKDDISEPLFSLVNVVSEKRKKGRKEGFRWRKRLAKSPLRIASSVITKYFRTF